MLPSSSLAPLCLFPQQSFCTCSGEILRAHHWNVFTDCHQGDLKHAQHLHIFSFTLTVFPLRKTFLCLWFCLKFPGCSCPVRAGSLAIFATETPTPRVLPGIHSPSCAEYFLPALTGKLGLLKCDANTSVFSSWYNSFAPRGVLVCLQDLAA